MVLYQDPKTGQRVRTRLTPEVSRVILSYAGLSEVSWLTGVAVPSRQVLVLALQGHVSFESRFEMTALMTVDFRGEAIAVSSNPFWLLWPKGQTHHRHAPDFSSEDATDRLSLSTSPGRSSPREGSAPASTHARCMSRVGLGVRGIHYDRQDCRTQPTSAMRLPPSAVRAVSRSTIRYRDLREAIGAQRRAVRRADRQRPDGAELDENHLICSTYHMIWNREIHVDLARPLTWTTVITSP